MSAQVVASLEAKALSLLSEARRSCEQHEIEEHNGDPLAVLVGENPSSTTSTKDRKMLELVRIRNSLEKAKRQLENEIRSMTMENYRVNNDTIRLNEQMSDMLARSSGILNRMGNTDGNPQSSAVTIHGGISGGTSDIGSVMIGIVRKLNRGPRSDMIDAVSKLWKLLESSMPPTDATDPAVVSRDTHSLVFIMPSLDCYIGEESTSLQYKSSRLSVIRDMRQAGALQSLLIGLGRCQREGWTEEETSIAKILSILVAHEEEDSALLLNNATDILQVLHESIVNSSDRAIVGRRSRANSLITLDSQAQSEVGGGIGGGGLLLGTTGDWGAQLNLNAASTTTGTGSSDSTPLLSRNESSTSDGIPQLNRNNTNTSVDSGGDVGSMLPVLRRARTDSGEDYGRDNREDEEEENYRQVRSTAALALHRLCSVLSEGWLKQDRKEQEVNQVRDGKSTSTSVNDKETAALEAAFGPLAGASISRQTSQAGAADKPTAGGPLSRTNSGTNTGTASRSRRRSGTGIKPQDALTDASRTMEMITRLMVAVCGAVPLNNDAVSSASSFVGTDRHSNPSSAATSRPGSMKLSGSGFGGTMNFGATLGMGAGASTGDSLNSSRNSSDFSSGLWSFHRDNSNSSDSNNRDGKGGSGSGSARLPIPTITPGIAYPESERNSLMPQSAKLSGSMTGTSSSGNNRPLSHRETSSGGNSGEGGGVGESDISGIEPAEIMCCEALVVLSKIPQCRTLLVCGNVAFPLLQRWLEVCTSMFSAEMSWVHDMGFEHSNNKNERLRLAQVMVSRISSALVNLMGGDGYADPFVSSPNIPGADRSDSDRYSVNGTFKEAVGADMTDWIDSQLVCQGIAANLIRLVDASVEDYSVPLSSTSPSSMSMREAEKASAAHAPDVGIGKSSAHDDERGAGDLSPESNERPPFSLLSRAVQIRLCSILQQLCCRHTPQRRQLYTLGAPYSFCSLFVHAVKTFRYESQRCRSTPRRDSAASGVPPPLPTSKSSSFFDDYADYGGASSADRYYTEEENQKYFLAIASPCLDSLTTFMVDSTSNFVPQPPDRGTMTMSMTEPRLHDSRMESALQITADVADSQAKGEKEKERQEAKTPPLIRWMSSEGFVEVLRLGMSLLPQCRARLACLHVVSSLTEWPLSLRALYDGNVTDTLVHISYEDTNRLSSGLWWWPWPGSSGMEDVEGRPGLTRQPTAESSATDLYMSSIGSNSSGHSELEVSSASVSPRFKGGTLDALSKPALGMAGARVQQDTPNLALDASSRPGLSRGDNAYPPDPTPASDLMSLLSGIGLSRPRPPAQEHRSQIDSQSDQFRGVRPSAEQVEREKKDPRAFTESNMREETMTVCLALANLCQHSAEFAQRVYKNGLLSIMLKHSKSPHVECKRQALRCISAMCEVMKPSSAPPSSHSPTAVRGEPTGPMQRDREGAEKQSEGEASIAEIVEVLKSLNVVLSDTDDFSLPMLQLEAMLGIARLAVHQQDEILDYIFDGPLRAICSLMIDPNNDKELRTAAENVLVACGFPGGAADFQMCANDFEIFHDWFTLRRSLAPQQTGHLLTWRWMESLFVTSPGGSGGGRNPTNTFMTLSSSNSSHNALASTQGSDLFELMSPGSTVTGGGGGLLTPERNRSPVGGLLEKLPGSPERLNRKEGLSPPTLGFSSAASRTRSADRTDAVRGVISDGAMDRTLRESPRKASLGEEPTMPQQQEQQQRHGPMKTVRRTIKTLAVKGIEQVKTMFEKDRDLGTRGSEGRDRERDTDSPSFRDSDGQSERQLSADMPLPPAIVTGTPDADSGMIRRMLPFCVPSRTPTGAGTGSEHHDVTSPAGTLPVYRSTPGRTSPTAQMLVKFLGSTPDNAIAGTIPDLVAGYFSGGIKSGLDPDYAGYDAPPFIVWELMEHFFPSKLHRLLVIDMVSLGCYDEVHIDVRGVHHGRDRNNSSPRTRDRYSVSKSRGSATSISSSKSRRSSSKSQPEREDAAYPSGGNDRPRTASSNSTSTKSVRTSVKSDISSGKSVRPGAKSDASSVKSDMLMTHSVDSGDDSNSTTRPLPTATATAIRRVSEGDESEGVGGDNTETDVDSLEGDETSIADEDDDEDEDISDLDLDEPAEYAGGVSMEGFDLGASVGEGGSGKEDGLSTPFMPMGKSQKVFQYLLPQPHEMYALMMPSRSYHHHNIEIMCRVVERMVADYDRTRIWALVFKNCLFAIDFHETFLAALRRTPQIVALSFRVDAASTQVINTKENVGALGYLGGMLPPTIRWLTFAGSLTRDGLQILCILLLRNNAAFNGPAGGEMEDEELYPDDEDDDVPEEHIYEGGGTTPKRKSSSWYNHPHRRNLRWRRSRGLVGLSVTQCSNFDKPQVQYLCCLLSFAGQSGSPTAAGPPATGDTPKQQRSRGIHVHVADQEPTVYSGKGLKLVDLTFNRLNDPQCAELLSAACHGRVEDLDLGGNNIRKGAEFISVFQSLCSGFSDVSTSSAGAMPDGSSSSGSGLKPKATAMSLSLHNPNESLDVDAPSPGLQSPPGSRLRHLGLGANQLSQGCVLALLKALGWNSTLTSLDLSDNDIHGSENVDEGLRNFLIENTGLRNLDLSINKLTTSTATMLHLGLLENDSLLLLNLSGNPSAADPGLFDFQQMQSKLKTNRGEYKYSVVTARKQIKDMKRKLAKMKSGDLSRKMRENAAAGQGEPTEVQAVVVAASAVPEAVVTPIGGADSGDADEGAQAGPSADLDHAESESRRAAFARSRTRSAPILVTSRAGLPIDSMYRINMGAPRAEGVGPVEDPRYPQPSAGTGAGTGTDAGTGAGAEGRRRGSDNISTTIGGTRASTTMHNTVHGNLDQLAPQRETSTRPLQGDDSTTSSAAAALTVTHNSNSNGVGGGGTSTSGTYRGDQGSSRSALNRSANISLMADLGDADELEAPITPAKPGTGNGARMMPSSSSDLALTASTHSSNTITTSISAVPDVLNVLFSAPLAWRDKSNRLHPLERLDYTSERDALVAVFKEVRRDVSLCFDFATTDSMRTALSFGCRALHFSGHGHPQSLNFEDGRAGLQVVTADRLKKLLQAGSSELALDFVFVAACYSKQTGEVFIECGVKHVVAVKVDAMIQDSAAKAFTRAFYVALLSGKTVQQSFDIAREALKASPYVPDAVLEGEKFILLPEPKEGQTNLHDEVIFTGCPVPSWPLMGQCVYGTQSAIGMSPELADQVQLSSCLARYPPPPPLDYEGREVDMHRCITNIIAPARRLVTLAGEEGLGKSALAAAVCNYLSDRRLPLAADGILYLRCEDILSHLAFLEKLKYDLLNSPALLPSLKAKLMLYMGEEAVAPGTLTDEALELYDPDAPEPGAAAAGDTESSEEELCYRLEEEIIWAMSSLPLRMLLVLDNIDVLVAEQSTATYLKLFIGRLFERAPQLKMFITASAPLSPEGFGVVEYCVPLGPLTLRNALRLYARLAPPLANAAAKRAFVSLLSPQNQSQVTINSANITVVTGRILQALGNGCTTQVIALACTSTKEQVTELLTIAGHKEDVINRVLSHYFVRGTPSLQRSASLSSSLEDKAEDALEATKNSDNERRPTHASNSSPDVTAPTVLSSQPSNN